MKMLTSALLATALLTSSGLAMAQPDHGDRGRSGEHGRGHDHDRRNHDGDRYDRDRERDRDYGYERDRRHDRDDYRGHGRGHDRDFVPPGHRWERGNRYDGRVVVVRDYRTYRLRQPPRGYHWVRGDDGQYLLVAVATGIIMDIVLH